MIDTIKTERNRYLDFFRKGIDYLKKDKTQFAVELLIETGEEELKHPFNLIRVDFIFKDDEKVNRINALQLDSILDYETIKNIISNSKIEVNPFCWDNCKIITDKIDINKLIPWIEKWIDIEESRQTEYSNSIHNCSMIQKSDGIEEITVDFGTAPIDAFLELIEFLTDNNEKIEIK
ncbi:hypothetical protein [Gaoshiqia sediminis]|uniref:Uncharacterized protein n=1 Tax=Gaoshiqia sediminis TaxID=2986998 RepID=A0AA41Y622_9BACT|nr:hypothetical protein [Gaoshiqia sediminis]MCW0481792.1 hypothetical protein [Gaoshiqia sediminis]